MRRDTYLNTLLSSRISERTNILSRMQAASPVEHKKSSMKDTEPPSARLIGDAKIMDKHAELDSEPGDLEGRI